MSDFLAIGHVARDEFLDESGWRLGGSALYGAVTAARLGWASALVTRVGPAERGPLVERCAELGVALHALPSIASTTFVFRWVDGRRDLRLRSRARAIALGDVPPELRAANAILLGSVAHELDHSLLGSLAPARTVVAAQGYLREWGADGTVVPRDWEDAHEVLPNVRAAVLSEEDVAGDLAGPRRWARHGPVIVTLAERGALILDAGTESLVPGFRASAVANPIGAGDAFAAGLAIALSEGRALPDATRFANAVASFAVEGVGTDGLADRARVEARLGR